MAEFKLQVNNQAFNVNVDADTPLLWVLRDELELKGTKFGCGKALCGACTVHFNGNPVRSCSLSVAAAARGKITTIEGLSKDGDHPLQQAWIELDVPQCGYCQAGQIMTAASLLEKKKNPSEEDINTAMSGNLCRCGTYVRIKEAIQLAARKERKS